MVISHYPLRIFSIFQGLLIIALLFSGCKEKKEEVKPGVRAVPVITGNISTRRVEYFLTQVGTLEASQSVTLRSEIEGRVIEILFKEGREVRIEEVAARSRNRKRLRLIIWIVRRNSIIVILFSPIDFPGPYGPGPAREPGEYEILALV